MSRKPKRRQRKQPRRASAKSAARGTLRLGLVLLVLVAVNLYVFLWRGGTSIPDVMEQAAVAGAKEGAGLSTGDPEEPVEGERAEPPRPADETEGSPDEAGRWVEGEVAPGDSLIKILRREGLTPPEADEVIRALGDQPEIKTIREGQTYRIRFDDAGRLMEFVFKVSQVTQVRAVRGKEGVLVGEAAKAATKLQEVELGGTIEGSLYASLKAAGEDTRLVAFFVDVFAYDLNFYIDTHVGDSYRMVVEKEYLDGQFLRYGQVLAAEYSGKAGTFRAFYWKPPKAKEGKYFNEKGQSIEKTFLKTPLKFSRISSGFNPRRMHPVLHVRRGHFGVDYAAPTGTPIWAAAGGVIAFRGRKGGAGNCVIIKHDNGYATTYMHMSKFRKGQSVGRRVRQKDVIGYVGMTGLATGPHLHFSVRKSGRYVDPGKIKMSRGASVAKADRGEFEAHTGALVTRLAAISTAPAAVAGSNAGGAGSGSGTPSVAPAAGEAP
ncbi:MAG TPA: peptidoglycan DD-metalloendopeptidase family protein [Kofleriaceae bacterium]|nr:peptidoglycan DD-metalloendopeptidase family protein [Kofleriaceae bacterium]